MKIDTIIVIMIAFVGLFTNAQRSEQSPKPTIKNNLNMSNKATLEKANLAISKGDYEGFLTFCTDDTKWTFVGDQILEGKEAVRQYMATTYLEPPQFKVEKLIAENDFVTAVGEISMKNKEGKTIHYSYCDVWQFHEGKMAELTAFVIEIK